MVWTSKDGPKTLPLCSDCAHRKPCEGCPYQRRAEKPVPAVSRPDREAGA